MSIQDTPPTTLILGKDSAVAPGNWKALAGKTIGVSTGGWSEIMVKHLLTKNGVDASAVKFTSTPDATTMLTALKRGAIDGFSGIEPAQRQAVKGGDGKVFFDLEDRTNLRAQWPSPFVATCLQASATYAKDHAKVVAAMRKAIGRAYTDVAANPSVAVDLAKKLQPNVDPVVLASSVEHLAVTWSKDGSISEPAMNNLQTLLTEYKVLPKKLPYDQTTAP
jgi:ABC-type nitrate/sulfonate/bicarbonate transport system substrate-binding protein